MTTTRETLDQIEAGDRFAVLKGSKAGSFKVSGDAEVLELGDGRAVAACSVGRFGLKFEVHIAAELVEDGVVEVTGSGSAFDTVTIRADVAEWEDDRIVLEDQRGKLDDTVLELDGEGGAELRSHIPGLGRVQFLFGPA